MLLSMEVSPIITRSLLIIRADGACLGINTGNNFVDLKHPPSDKFTDEVNDDTRLNPEEIGNAYLYLVNQHRSAWTWELDLRPAHEKW